MFAMIIELIPRYQYSFWMVIFYFKLSCIRVLARKPPPIHKRTYWNASAQIHERERKKKEEKKFFFLRRKYEKNSSLPHTPFSKNLACSENWTNLCKVSSSSVRNVFFRLLYGLRHMWACQRFFFFFLEFDYTKNKVFLPALPKEKRSF